MFVYNQNYKGQVTGALERFFVEHQVKRLHTAYKEVHNNGDGKH